MDVVTQQTDKTTEELTRLFSLLRLAELNKRYYGRRADHFELLQKSVLVAGAILAAIALGLLLATEHTIARYSAAVLAGLSAILTTATQFLKWDEQARRFYYLHHSYGHLFAQVESLITDIRRSDEVTPEQVGSATSLHDTYGRIEVLDEAFPDRKLIDKIDAEVRVAFPDNYMWTNL